MNEAQIGVYVRDYKEGEKWKRVKNWAKEDIVLGIILRTISRKIYKLLRDKKIIPLPCETVLNEAYAEFQLEEGFLDDVFEILLKVKVTQLDPRDRVVCLRLIEHIRLDNVGKI